jgi:hypothetical protein
MKLSNIVQNQVYSNHEVGVGGLGGAKTGEIVFTCVHISEKFFSRTFGLFVVVFCCCCYFSPYSTIFQLYDAWQSVFIGGRENPDTLYNVFGERPPTFRK